MSIISIRNFIIDNSLTEKDTIILNSLNFDDLVLEYRQTYNESIPIPFYFLRVLVTENSTTDKVNLDRIKIVKDDAQRFFQDYLSFSKRDIKFHDLPYADKIIYRCGWCGNVVEVDGSEFTSETRKHKIEILEKFKGQVTQKDVNGKCCPNGPGE